MILSLDCECTGLDIYHGSAKPFFISLIDEKEELTTFEWDVDPLTREPDIDRADLIELRDIIEGADELAIQNAIYDGSVLKWYYNYRGVKLRWDWSKVRDTLYAAHLLASNEPHDLTTLGIRYLGYNIEKYEKELEEAVKHCRRLTGNREFIERNGSWKVAKAGYSDMPSIKDGAWRADYWLPKAVWRAERGRDTSYQLSLYETVLSSYGSIDASVTLPIWIRQREEIESRGLTRIYQERLKLLPIVYDMESRGVTINKERQQEQIREFREVSEAAGAKCKAIAESYDYELTLPKSGNNKSLVNFVPVLLEDVGEEIPDISKANYDHGKGGSGNVFYHNRRPTKHGSGLVDGLPKTEGGQISLNKNALEALIESLPPRSKPLLFFQSLRDKRKRDTGISYLEGYERFWLPFEEESDEWFYWRLLHPRLNVTGTSTLRWSSSSPNEQNISKQEETNLRYCFGPAPGREWWSLDAKNIELRIPGYESGEKDLIDLFEKANEPPFYGSEHLLNFSIVYPDLWEDALKNRYWEWKGENYGKKIDLSLVGPYVKKKYAATYYQWCKNGDFAVGYGAVDRPGGVGTADRAFHRPGSHAKLKSRFAKKEALNQKYIDMANRLGYVETLPDKTVDPKRGYPLTCTRSNWGGVLPTVPLNYHVQGTAMWWMMKAMIRVFGYLRKISSDYGENYRIVMQVHDEMVFDFPESRIEIDEEGNEVLSNLPIVKEVQRLMSKSGDDIGIPTPVSITYHPRNWKEETEV